MAEPGAASHAGFDEVDGGTIAEVLAEVTAALDEARVPYVLLGGLASRLLGRPRCSSDVDLFVKPEDAGAALAVLGRRGFDTEETNRHWLYKGTRGGVLVDVLFKAKGDIYLDDEMLARARVCEVRGRPVRVIPREDLVVIKAIVHDEETPRHWHDALSLLASPDVDWDYLVRRAHKGPARVLSLLCYAVSTGLAVPPRPLQALCGVLVPAERNGARP